MTDLPSPKLLALWKTTANLLKGSERRKFMAEVVETIGYGGQCFAEKHLGWCRKTIRKGAQELASGKDIQDQFHCRGRKKSEELLPQLLDHIKQIVEPVGQTDPTFRSHCPPKFG